MEGLKERGIESALMSPEKSVLSFKSKSNGVLLLEFKKGIFSLWHNIKTLKKYCTKNQIDLIHGHDSHAHTLLWMAYKFGGLQTISIITRRLINPIKPRSIKKYNYSGIKKIICISEAVKNILLPSIEDNSRLIVIHSSVKRSASTTVIKKKSLKKNFVIGYVAAFTAEKDHRSFIETAKYLMDQEPKVSYKFILVGSGPLMDKYQVENKNMKKSLEFTGFIDEVEEVYSEMDLLLHTSKSEALGTSILDAMKLGIPVVASNIGGIPEIITHGENGYLSDQGDIKMMAKQIHQIANDVKLYDNLSSNCLLSVSKFDTTLMVDKTLEVYKNLFKKNNIP